MEQYIFKYYEAHYPDGRDCDTNIKDLLSYILI